MKNATLEVIPVNLRDAQEFIQKLHRHNKPPNKHKFSVGVLDGERLVGVAVAGRPLARHYDDGLTIEVLRTCTDGTPNANSMLYGALWRASKALGYRRCITYTQHDESGASLRGAGWVRVRELKPRPNWKEASQARRGQYEAVQQSLLEEDPRAETGGVPRVLWEIRR